MVFGCFRFIFVLVFAIHFSLFHASSSPPPPVAGDMAMAFVDYFFLPIKARYLFHFLYVLRGLHCLAVQRCGSGFWGAASSTHVLVRGIGVSINFP